MANFVDKRIIDLRPKDNVRSYFYVKEADVKTTTTNNKYMNFILSDKTGDINAKLWDWDEENANRFKAGTIVKVQASVVEWQGQLQMKIEFIGNTLPSDDFKIEDYIPSAPYPAQSMYDYIVNMIDKINDEDIKKIVRNIYCENKERILVAPAAKKNHHALRSGLLYHTATMLKSAVALSSVYTFLNTDLLFAGVMLHDIGKLFEMEVNELGLVNEYSKEGIMLGHLVQGVAYIAQKAVELGINSEKALLLQHMILSHHYIPEHGSPKAPQFPEAELLHYLDIMDARMYDMNAAYSSTEPGTFSDKIWSLENRSVYKPRCFFDA